MNDVAVFDHINALSAEEEELFASASDGSGLSTEADHASWSREQLKPYIDRVINSFGWDRVMFGSDA